MTSFGAAGSRPAITTPRKRSMKRIIVPAAAVLLVGGGLIVGGCGQSSTQEATERVNKAFSESDHSFERAADSVCQLRYAANGRWDYATCLWGPDGFAAYEAKKYGS